MCWGGTNRRGHDKDLEFESVLDIKPVDCISHMFLSITDWQMAKRYSSGWTETKGFGIAVIQAHQEKGVMYGQYRFHHIYGIR